MILSTFPDFNIRSLSLLILVVQGLIFAGMLLWRYRQKRVLSDLLLALILLITCYHRAAYTIGFMGWYDAFRTTKVNYLLVNLDLALAPLIFFYTKSITRSNFRFRRLQAYHFIPALVYILFKVFIAIYDAQQPDFARVQNGVLMVFEIKYVQPMRMGVQAVQAILYLAFALQLYYFYRQKIQQHFSNTYQLELNWLRNFLYIYSFLFLYDLFQALVIVTITEMSWQQQWWYHLFSAIAILYVGIKGYYTDTPKLSALQFNMSENPLVTTPTSLPNEENQQQIDEQIKAQRDQLAHFMLTEKPYLNAELTLLDLARLLHMNRAQLSEVINLGFNKNFNDFINYYRVEAVKEMLTEGKHKEFSILGIAYECGFNSKATFNRSFKRMTNVSPTEYLKSIGG